MRRMMFLLVVFPFLLTMLGAPQPAVASITTFLTAEEDAWGVMPQSQFILFMVMEVGPDDTIMDRANTTAEPFHDTALLIGDDVIWSQLNDFRVEVAADIWGVTPWSQFIIWMKPAGDCIIDGGGSEVCELNIFFSPPTQHDLFGYGFCV